MRRATLLTGFLLTAAGCGAGGSDEGGGAGLKAMFEQTKVTPDLEHAFDYGDTRYIADTYGPEDASSKLLGYGADAFLQAGGAAGTDPLRSAVAFSIGASPHSATLLRGGATNPDGVKAALTKLGAKPGTVAGRDGLVWGPEGSMHLQDTSTTAPIGATGEFDRVILAGDTVIAGRYAAEAGALAGEGDGDSLADDPTYSTYLRCLGDVIVAHGGDTPLGPTASGILRPAAATDPVSEVLCVLGGDPAKVQASLERFENGQTVLPSTQAPSSQLWSKVTVERKDGYVRATFTDREGVPAGTVAAAVQRNDLFPGG